MDATLLRCESSAFRPLALRAAEALRPLPVSACSSARFVVSPTMDRLGIRVTFVSAEGMEAVAAALAAAGLRVVKDEAVREVRAFA